MPRTNQTKGKPAKAIILAAGNGTRLQPLTNRIPKAMVPLAGRPLLEHTIEWLHSHGVSQIAINLHAHAHVITEHFGDGARFGVNLTYSFEPQLLGTAGAVKNLAGFCGEEPVYVVYGDVYTRLNLDALCDSHRKTGAAVTIGLYVPDDPSQCGIVQQDADGWITSFREKPDLVPEPALANAGIYVLEPRVLGHLRCDVPQDFGIDVFPELAGRGLLAGFRVQEPVWDIGSFDRLRRADQHLGGANAGAVQIDRVSAGVNDYLGKVTAAIAEIKRRDIATTAEVILAARARGARFYIAGNGGSSATASHMVTDLIRAASESPGPPLRCYGLTDNVPALTAWSNDVSYAAAFERQIEQLMEAGDVLIAISASGQSANVIAAVEAAHHKGATVIGLCGFGGGKLATLADASIVVPSNEFGPVEDVHLVLNHLFADLIRDRAQLAVADPGPAFTPLGGAQPAADSLAGRARC